LYALQEIDAGRLWPNTAAPPIACYYWGLPEGADMRQLVLAVRADEAHHSHVNHTLARVPQDGANPFVSKDSHLVP
jgi:threonyl-tRNA synthetase